MATETKQSHTPAPWTLETVATSIGVCHKVGPLGSTTKLKSACLYDDCYSDQPRDLQLLADARLIASAPELLEALYGLLGVAFQNKCLLGIPYLRYGKASNECDCAAHTFVQQAEAAIAKAEGK